MDEGLREQQRRGAIRNIIKVVGKIQISFVLARKGKRFTLPEVTEKCR